MTQTALTREQVENAEPGIDLNVMVAEHIFGWRRISGPTHDYDGPVEHGEVLVPPDMSEFPAYAMMPPRGSMSLSYFINQDWSKDISAAWELVEKLQQQFETVTLDKKYRDKWCLILVSVLDECGNTNAGDFEGYGDTAPEAICKAALLAVLDL